MGVYCSEGVSGAHLNCAVTFAVTFAHAVYDRLPWWKLPGYWISQVVGAFVGAAAIYLLNYQKIQKLDPDKETTQSNFATYPSSDINNATAFYTEALATGMLLLCIYAITDQHNRSPGTVGTPFAFALMIMALVIRVRAFRSSVTQYTSPYYYYDHGTRHELRHEHGLCYEPGS
ncbi:hypothetical protein PF007_g20262 [Phytophthora fragariae]|uniref:Aquaporin n=1 Tax=Phytophthora fragariae TaxID=53985 RepID=A0A6A3RN80_9STRA|nr:hypothetical protein PF003_g7442 [Phytophthora fragariae]KAE8924989.1 hypothetical protein PF009_g24792 [Phytophthora fragariae]KAE9087725.1 hypothetical protein PF007_g20262 [Phytophthora fragariae]KAE9099786.1 hypothetical protein PF006_g23055 [Phytophthora fragariae]KAE9283188.1 hypothetical protein PF001_g22966 [Phytophthora fragariae]